MAWNENEYQKKVVSRMLNGARAIDEKGIVQNQQKKAEECGKDWYRFLRGDKSDQKTD